ncbi:MAG: radical SAM family heme chaperone HemW [bacterium]
MKPFGLYVHVPFCDGKCSYCAFYSTHYEPDLADRYVAAARQELTQFQGVPGAEDREYDTVYFGGGTPTILADPQLERLCGLVTAGRARPVEWTVEANPGSLSRSGLGILKRSGVNRISLGAQSFDDCILRKLGRRHTAGDIVAAVAMLREAGFDNIGIDLIACVPGVDVAGWRATLDSTLALEPQHISVYALTVEEGTALERKAIGGECRVLDDEEQLAFIHMTGEILANEGYGRYEISNYARAGFECRHNVACWRGAEYVGLGPAASSHMGSRRWTNIRDLDVYLRNIEAGTPPGRDSEELSRVVKATEMVIFGLRLAEGVDIGVVGARAGLDSAQEKKLIEVLRCLSDTGLLESRAGSWILTDRGRDVADHVAVEIIGWEDGNPVT